MKKLILAFMIALALITYISYSQLNNRTVPVVSNKPVTQQISPSTNRSKQVLKIMTYNIRHGLGLDNRLDLDRIVSVIKESDADIIGLNEVDRHLSRSLFKDQTKYLANQLGMNYIFGPALNKGIGSYGNAVLTRLPVEESSNYILPGLKGNEQRSLLAVKVRFPDDSSNYILTTHLSLNKQEREIQHKWIEEYVADLNNHFILMGDFNSGLATDFKFKPVFQGLKSYPAINPRDEIDLFFSDLADKIINGYTLASQASDHLPVIMEIVMNKKV